MRVDTPVTRALALAAAGAGESVVAQAYVQRGTTWHLLLHTLIGLGLGLAAGATASALVQNRGRARHPDSRGRPFGPVRWAVAGQLVSIVPDLLFVVLRIPHAQWMDVFIGHITIHLVPAPLLVALTVFLLGSSAWFAAVVLRRRLVGAVLAVSTVAALGTALALAAPIPTSLSDYSDRLAALPGWLC